MTGVMSANWREFRDRLQPSFDLDADALLARVTPQTARAESKTLSATGAGATISVPGGPMNPEGSAVDFSDEKASDLPGTADLGALDDDPMLQYHLAAALYQEVAMLNEFISRADSSADSRAYVVRLNLQAMMYRQNPGVDLYATLSFFAGEFDPLSNENGFGRQRISVVPMLVTDSIETAVQSRSRRQLVDLAITLAAGVESVGGSGTLGRRYDRIISALGQSYNSTYQVIRSTDNTIRVKLGAANQVLDLNGRGVERGFISRTAPITLLVIVERDQEGADWPDTISVTARTAFRSPETGALKRSAIDLPKRFAQIKQTELYTTYGMDEAIDALAADYARRAKKGRGGEAIIRKLAVHISSNDYEAFANLLDEADNVIPELEPATDLAPLLWTLLVERFADTQASYTTIPLDNQRAPDVYALQPHVRPVMLDDGSSLKVTLDGGRFLDDNSLTAALIIVQGDNVVRVPASKTKARNTGSTVDIEFPWIDAAAVGSDAEPSQYWISLRFFNEWREQYEEVELADDFLVWSAQLRLDGADAITASSSREADRFAVHRDAIAFAELVLERMKREDPSGESDDGRIARALTSYGTIPVSRVSTKKIEPSPPLDAKVVTGAITLQGGLLRLAFETNRTVRNGPERFEIRVTGALPRLTLAGSLADRFAVAEAAIIAKDPAGLRASISAMQAAREPAQLDVNLANLKKGEDVVVKVIVDGREVASTSVKVIDSEQSADEVAANSL